MPMSDSPPPFTSGCGHGPSLTDPPGEFPTDGDGVSRFPSVECPRMLGAFDSAGQAGLLRLARPALVPSRSADAVGAPDVF